MIKTFDYSQPYKPKAPSINFVSWCNAHLDKETNTTPKAHYILYDEVVGNNHQNTLALCHRGFAKSTILTNRLPIKIACDGGLEGFGDISNLVIFSATVDQAMDQLRAIRDLWDNSDVLQEFLQLARDKRGKVIADKVDWLALVNSDGNIIHIQAKGAGQQMRGTKKNGVRPQLLIFDDILSDNILTSELERKKLRTWFYSTVQNSVDINHYKKIVVGTPMVQDDLLMNMASGETYYTVKFPIAMEFPVEESKMITSWPDRFTPKRVMDQYREAKDGGSEAEFYREMMLQVVNEDLRIFKDEYFKHFSINDIKTNIQSMNVYTSMDLAVSQNNRADFSAIVTIGVDHNSHWYILKVSHGRFTPIEVINELFDHVKAHKPIEVRAEKAALQQVLNAFIDERMEQTRTYFYTTPLENNNKQSKEYRVRGLQPLMKTGRIHFPRDVDLIETAELINEMKGVTTEGFTTKYKDLVDCLANFLDPSFIIYPDKGMMFDEDSDMESYDVSEPLSDYYD